MFKPLAVGTIAVAAAVGPDLIETHYVSVPTLISVVAAIGGGMWWLSHKFTRIDDQIESKFASVQEQLAEIRQTVNNLPCPKIIPKIAEVVGAKVEPCEPDKNKP